MRMGGNSKPKIVCDEVDDQFYAEEDERNVGSGYTNRPEFHIDYTSLSPELDNVTTVEAEAPAPKKLSKVDELLAKLAAMKVRR